MRSASFVPVQDRARGQRHLVPATATLIQGTALKAPVPGMLALGAHEPVRPAPTKQRRNAPLLGAILVHELRQAVAFLKLNPIPCHVRLPIFQLLGTIRAGLDHWMSLVRNQEARCDSRFKMVRTACRTVVWPEESEAAKERRTIFAARPDRQASGGLVCCACRWWPADWSSRPNGKRSCQCSRRNGDLIRFMAPRLAANRR